MLALGNTGPGNIDADLTAVLGVQKLRKAAPVVPVHGQGELEFVCGQIGQVQGVELFGKAALRHFGHQKSLRLGLERQQQLHDFPQSDLVGHGDAAVPALRGEHRLHALKFAALGLSLQQIKETLDQVVNVQ